MCRDDVIEAGYDLILGEGCISTGLEVRGRDLTVAVAPAMVVGMGKGGNVKLAGLQLMRMMLAVHVAWGCDQTSCHQGSWGGLALCRGTWGAMGRGGETTQAEDQSGCQCKEGEEVG